MAENDGRNEHTPIASIAQPGPAASAVPEHLASSDADVSEEVRLAVVLYGGSSLAIYINGMVQELFKLVRATAVRQRREDEPGGGPGIVAEEPLVPDADLTSTERVYRRLGRLRTADPATWEAIAAGQAHAPLGTRVVVDILSGSSAGGINGVFLAKALVGDLSLEELKHLWVDEGDVKTLIYDAASRVAPRLGSQSPVPSLLNGRRMYRLLLQALEGMERRDSSGRPRQGRTSSEIVSPYVDELDLYVTTTDLQGLDQWLKLENTKAYERRHRNVFHFSYTHDPTVPAGEPDLEHHNDFHANNNPFLAFAARCTSSLPFVFEPMQLRDIESHLETVEPYASNPSLYAPDGPVGKAWRQFYADYLPGPLAAPGPAAEALPFAERSFGDGGALDNSPFSYSIDRLLRAQAARRIDRKLLYVEPDPAAPAPLPDEPDGRGSRPTARTSRFDRPNPLRNTLLQVVSLPRYQTIREDLQRVQDRNRLALRLQTLLEEIWPVPPEARAGRRELAASTGAPAPWEAKPWVSQPFAASAGAVAVSPQVYKGYIRLRAETVVQQLAILVTRAVGLDEDSDDLLAMRLVVRAWRDHRYALPSSGDDPEGEQRVKDFLSRFDVDYRFRLIKFLQTSLDHLRPLNEQGRTCLANLGLPALAPDDRGAVDEIRRRREELTGAFWQLRRTLRRLRRAPRHPGTAEPQKAPGGQGPPGTLEPAGQRVAEGSPLLPFIQAIGIKASELRLILSEPTPKQQRTAADALMANPVRAEAFDALGDEIARQLALSDPAGSVPGAAPPQDQRAATPGGTTPAGRAAARTRRRARTIGGRVRAAVSRAAGPPGMEPSMEPSGWAQPIDAYLGFHRNNFDSYDVVALPLLYGTPIGEIDEVDVIRLSPREATSLIDEQELGRPKLGGASVGHLGGFFYDRWRRNDIMWGRLDAAECLIEAMVPPGLEHDAVAERLRWDAHRQILEEDLSETDRQDLESTIRQNPAAGAGSAPGAIPRGSMGSKGSAEPAGAGSLAGLTHEQASTYFRTVYATGAPPTKEMMRNAGRGMHVTGKVLQGVAESDTGGPEVLASKALRKPTQWVALLGSLLTGMVEVAVSGPRHLIFRHVVASLFLFEIVMLGLGIVLGLPAAAQLGTTSLALTLLACLTVWVLRIVVEADGGVRRRLIRIGAILCAAVLVAIVGLAIAQVRHLAKDPPGPLRTVRCWVSQCPAADNRE